MLNGNAGDANDRTAVSDLLASVDDPVGLTTSARPERNLQARLENAMDDANGNLNFVQLKPCPFSDAKRGREMDENQAVNQPVKR